MSEALENRAKTWSATLASRGGCFWVLDYQGQDDIFKALEVGISPDPMRFEATYVVIMSDLEHRGQWATCYSVCFVKYYF
jgi:hypothetical protein